MTARTAPLAAGMVAPDYGGRCLDGVLLAAAGALGRDVPGADAARTRLALPTADRVCVVLVDGLGRSVLGERAGHAPFLRRRLPDAGTLTSGFPSTTAVSLGMLGTGTPPGRTGMAGYSVRHPVTGGLATLVSWDGAGDPQAWHDAPHLLAQVAATGTPVTSVGPGRFAGSGLTAAALSGGEYVPAEALSQRVDVAVDRLRRGGLVYLYWGQVDKIGHQHGWRSPEWGDALAETDLELGRLARSVPAGTLLVITADHGMVDVEPGAVVDVAGVPELAAGVALVAGEPRAAHVHLEGSPDADEVRAARDRWRGVLGDTALVLTGDEAVDAGLFGPVLPRVRPVIGDLVVAATGPGGVGDSRTQTPQSLVLRGMHGSLTPDEMLVPFLVVS